MPREDMYILLKKEYQVYKISLQKTEYFLTFVHTGMMEHIPDKTRQMPHSLHLIKNILTSVQLQNFLHPDAYSLGACLHEHWKPKCKHECFSCMIAP